MNDTLIISALGVYLPVLWEQSFCWKNPLVLGYTRGHFSALVAMETDNSNELGAGANVDSIDSVHVTYLPLVDYEGKLLPVHFLSAEEVRHCFVVLGKCTSQGVHQAGT